MEDAVAHVLIRPARKEDLEALGKFGAHLMSLHHEWDEERFIPADGGTPRSYADWLESQLGRKNTVIMVAEIDDAAAGYAYAGLEGHDYMSLRGPAGVIHDIFVDLRQRGKGVGRKLLEAVLAELAARGMRQVVLSTAARNETAQRMFDAAGFRRTMIEMTKTLK
ncbi:MAG: GNAT family N-acetyltransferase [Shinella sp.]|nr:GNAT family N-acetyltransferase [Shinella sp.]